MRCRMVWQQFSKRIPDLHRWSWPLTIAVAMIYTACFANFISRHTSLPFWDGYVHVNKTVTLAAKLENASLLERLNPNLYLKGPSPERPPLLMAVAAILLGPNPGNTAIAYVWLTVRIAIILLALYLLSREVGTSRFVPAAALAIFASPLMCNFYRLYMMDEPFAAFALLAFSLILIDDRRQTMWSAFAAAGGILALFLVKPVAPALVFPFCVVRAVRALLPLRHGWADLKLQLPRLIVWVIPYVLLFGVMAALVYASPYGPAIREHYKLGLTGYWHKDIGTKEAFQLISLVLPPWILIASLLTLPFVYRLKEFAVVLYALGGLAWWILFSFFLTFNIEDRLLGQAMPFVVAGLLLCICQRPRVTVIVTVAAAFFFTCNILGANGRLPQRQRGFLWKTVRFLSPLPVLQQPVPEVGLLAFAPKVIAAIAPQKPTSIYGVFGDVYVEPNCLNMALVMTNPRLRFYVQSLPPGPLKFDLPQICARQWFITKSRRPHSPSPNTGLWTTLDCGHALITNPESPLARYFHKILESPIHQPGLEDTLVLWHLPSAPPQSAIVDALRWLKPRLTNDPPAFTAAIDSQLQALQAGTPAQPLP